MNVVKKVCFDLVDGNVEEICETVAETRQLARVSAVGLVKFTRVSIAAVTAEPYHFFMFSSSDLNVHGNTRLRSGNTFFSCFR